MLDIEQKIRALLGQGSEHERLDYKQSLDIDDKADLIEITKDIAAMLSSGGGSLLIGADDNGGFGTRFTDGLYDKFDETTLRAKLKKYIDEPFDVHVSSVKFDGHNFVLIECEGYRDGFVVLKADGQYEKNGKIKLIFRSSEVFVRHGSASERWRQHDIRRIIASQVSKERATWIKELSFLEPSGTENYRHIKSEVKAELSLIRSKLNDATLTEPDIVVSLDKIIRIGIEAIDDENDKVFNLSLTTVHDIYGLGFDSRGNWRLNNGFDPVELWYSILVRLPLLGGACIEAKRYDLVKSIALQNVNGADGEYYSNWYRHALTMSARQNYTPQDDGSILAATTRLFRQDLMYKELLGWDDDQGRTYIVSFDYLACLMIVDHMKRSDDSDYYTSFGFYEKTRIMPMMRDIVLDADTRGKVFDSQPPQIAYAINCVDDMGSRVGRQFWHKGQWRGELADFIQNAEPFN